jgi:hypothetical protein
MGLVVCPDLILPIAPTDGRAPALILLRGRLLPDLIDVIGQLATRPRRQRFAGCASIA